jgi:hypothetical protein
MPDKGHYPRVTRARRDAPRGPPRRPRPQSQLTSTRAASSASWGHHGVPALPSAERVGWACTPGQSGARRAWTHEGKCSMLLVLGFVPPAPRWRVAYVVDPGQDRRDGERAGSAVGSSRVGRPPARDRVSSGSIVAPSPAILGASAQATLGPVTPTRALGLVQARRGHANPRLGRRSCSAGAAL